MVVNTYFKKKEERALTYMSGGRCSQIEYIMCRRSLLKETNDCKVIVEDSVVKQHRMVVSKKTMSVKPKTKVKNGRKIKWWRLRDPEMAVTFSDEMRETIGDTILSYQRTEQQLPSCQENLQEICLVRLLVKGKRTESRGVE